MSNKNIQFRRGSKQDYDAIKASGNTDSHDIYLVGGSQHPDIVTTTGTDGQTVSTQETKPLTMYVGDESVKTEATNTILQEDLIVTNAVGAGSLKTYAKGTNIETILKELLSVEAWPNSGKTSTNYYSFSNFKSTISAPSSTATPTWNTKVKIYGSNVEFNDVTSALPTATAPTLTYKNFTYGYYDANTGKYYKSSNSKPSQMTSENVTLSTTAKIQLNATFSGFKDIKVNENGERVDENGNVLGPGSFPVLIDKAAMYSSNELISPLVLSDESGPSIEGAGMIVGLGSNSVSFRSAITINAKADSEVPTEKQTTLHTASITCDNTYYVLSNYGRYVDVTNNNAIYCTVAPPDKTFSNEQTGSFNSSALSYSVTGVFPIYTNSTNTKNYLNTQTSDLPGWLADNIGTESASNNESYSTTNAFVEDRNDFIFLFGPEPDHRMKMYVPSSKSVSNIEIFDDNFKKWNSYKDLFEHSDTTTIQISENAEVSYDIWTPSDSINKQGAKTFVKLTLASKTSVNS
jgi:hypothetical protein